MGQVNQLWLRLTAPVPPLATAQSQHEIRRVGGELDVRAVRRDRSAGQARILVGSSREVASTPVSMNSRTASIVMPDAVAKVGSSKSMSARSENVLPVRLPDVAMRALAPFRRTGALRLECIRRRRRAARSRRGHAGEPGRTRPRYARLVRCVRSCAGREHREAEGCAGLARVDACLTPSFVRSARTAKSGSGQRGSLNVRFAQKDGVIGRRLVDS
jgi:hypothetical protein